MLPRDHRRLLHLQPLAGDEGIRPGLLQDGTQENLDSLAKDGQLYERSGDYYTMESIEDMLDGIEEE